MTEKTDQTHSQKTTDRHPDERPECTKVNSVAAQRQKRSRCGRIGVEERSITTRMATRDRDGEAAGIADQWPECADRRMSNDYRDTPYKATGDGQNCNHPRRPKRHGQKGRTEPSQRQRQSTDGHQMLNGQRWMDKVAWRRSDRAT